MKPARMMIGSLLILATTGSIGCATAPPAGQRTAQTAVTQQAGDLAFQHRRQAMEFRELARHYELEAQVLATMKGKQHEDTLRSLNLAKSLRAAADEADQTAREYQRQLPHGRVY